VGGETNIVVFVDSIWVEAKYVEFKKAEIKVISLKRHFKGYEEPEFNIEELDKKGIITQLFRKIEIIDVSIWDYSTNKKLDIPSEVKGSEIKIKKPKDFRPGLYKLKVEYKEENELKTLEQEFTWGVLAINVNKSIYLPGEQAYIQIAALRDDGHTICDANLKLEITSPSGEQFSAPVQKSGECGPNNVTEKPDYFAYYQVGEVGIYEMELTNLDNGYKIKDSFEVRESVPFDIERIGPTRIWPKANYEMALKIKANQDFTGDIIETVPISFEILNQEIKQISNSSFIIQDQGDGTKSLTWQNITLQQGDEIEIKYTFDAPDITPYLHLIGPLKFYE